MEVLKMKTPTKNDITVRNAGVVIINNYIPMLFERLHLTVDNQFTSVENQKKAVKFLQYIVTGLPNTDEVYLPLPKVLCGLSVIDKVCDEIEITDSEKNLINGMMQSVIQYWSAIGDCSVDGFRGNWFVRDGILIEQPDKWELMVEKRAYDVLINRSPFSFTIIKFSWMNKPLHVLWPY
ncbi:hypothetical protein L1276_004882 [Flavobacterium sp. HSC-32F16]|uniref:contractile injection system tape measure protein n=1 Tax=Flavobacterium sp. HSC-32F16 TaxID=2910964 RepID=UPI0020A2C5C2|nr:contractile injection system tape measure protein [Flavobacterium sp. HSC-32F16]MCP2029688.1 hypothetical protein [Flavobacterium sp. HSC-32F16]